MTSSLCVFRCVEYHEEKSLCVDFFYILIILYVFKHCLWSAALFISHNKTQHSRVSVVLFCNRKSMQFVIRHVQCYYKLCCNHMACRWNRVHFSSTYRAKLLLQHCIRSQKCSLRVAITYETIVRCQTYRFFMIVITPNYMSINLGGAYS